ncbi:MAG: DUF4198 domain-containing protein, partial [Thermodesulfobacteriota bacterium]
MKKSLFIAALVFVGALGTACPAPAHFGLVLPSDQMITQGEDRTVKLELRFWHPFENLGMNLVKPKVFSVKTGEGVTDLRDTLAEKKIGEFQAWETAYQIGRPGLYSFYMEPEPYWEPAEDCFIIHLT